MKRKIEITSCKIEPTDISGNNFNLSLYIHDDLNGMDISTIELTAEFEN